MSDIVTTHKIKAVPKAHTSEHQKEECAPLFYVMRVVALIAFFLLFMPDANPVRVSGLIGKNLSLFTAAVSYSSLISGTGRAFRVGWVNESAFIILYVGAIILALAVVALAVSACMSLGNRKMKKTAVLVGIGGSIASIIGFVLTYVSYTGMLNATKLDKVQPMFPAGYWIYAVLMVVFLVAAAITAFALPKVEAGEKYEMETKFRLFLMFLPFALLAFVFCYLPLYGWRYAFFDYQAGDTLSMDNFVGFKWFTYLFQNSATRADIVRVIKNTLAMSGLGIATSWVPLLFAVFLAEITNTKFRKIVQTFTTIPNFISWILVYTVALAIFSTDGFINTFATNMGWISSSTNYLMGDSFTWLKMLAWGLWKGTGWSAIIYIAGISGIDRQLYEAATVDGAGRFQKMWHVTLPGLIPTYMVMLLMAVAGCLSNGLDQYLVFSNASNQAHMEVLDLYVYNLGFMGGSIPLSTVIGMAKSVISVVLLFIANNISKAVRGESIV
jgi:putative aldouronate transport system permease protein